MADTNSLKVIYIFEACARLRCPTEISALAAHMYHRFFRIKPDMSQFELYTYGSACIMLAHRFYEKDLTAEDLAMVAASIVHGTDYYLSSKMITKLAKSINFTSLVIAVNTNFEISFKEERSMTPGDFLKSIQSNQQQSQNAIVELNDSMSVESEDNLDEAEYLLTNNSKHLISGHRYLTHYLQSIRLLLVEPAAYSPFNRLCNIAWTFLNDFHWSPVVMCHLPDHIACACLMMAIELCTNNETKTDNCEEEPANTEQFRSLLTKKWNLILCDDLSNEKLNRTIYTIMKHYGEYELIFRKEFAKDVIEP